MSFGSLSIDARELTSSELRAGEGMDLFSFTWDWALAPYGLNRAYPTFQWLLRGQLASLPNRLVYSYGEALDLRGASLVYRLGDLEEETQALLSEHLSTFDPYHLGTQMIDVEAPYVQDSFPVIVEDYALGLRLIEAPAKLRYAIGEALDLSGIEVMLEMASGNELSIDVDEEMVDGFDSSRPGSCTVWIRYDEFSCAFEVWIDEAEVSTSETESTSSEAEETSETGGTGETEETGETEKTKEVN